ncbi:hypothetical protein BG006_007699 [Podila minutissima]|uniref:Uncharacterized protein n=1 Tax=Podila minutissima TaxID=64525 RepID=A0A9P5VK37_9FUNG|nr:hypothetical protein BG006_007699 [Podila minutissima]
MAMLRQLQHGLRITIILSSFALLISSSIFFSNYMRKYEKYKWGVICAILISVISFIFYICSIRFHAITRKAVRAIPLLAIAGVWFYVSLSSFDCYSDCTVGPVCTCLSIACSCLVVIEVAVTLRLGPIAPVKPKEVIIVSPQELQQQLFQQQPQQQQHYLHSAPHPGNISYPYQQQSFLQYSQYAPQSLQPGNIFVSGTLIYEDQSHLYQQQQYYQQQQHQLPSPPPPPQQHQQQQQQYQLYAYPAPGSTVTATPQPGGKPIAPYPSPGTSVAVSPVLPVGGYPIASASPHA